MVSLRRFDISSISRKLNGINARISVDNCALFPCLTLLSSYQFKKRFVKILPNGDIQGGFTRMIISLIDFSFVRSLTAQRYTIKGPPPYDPVSLFLLELFRYIDQYPNMDQFLKDLRDKDKGRAYRAYAGIHMDNIPSKGTFSHFKARLGEGLYMDEAMSQNQIHTAILFGVKEQLDKQGLCLNTIRSNIVEVAPDMDRIILRCPKIPTDTDARIGVRNDPKNSARKQKIFGYNMVLSTSVELDLKLELPVAVVNMAGNGKEGEKIIDLSKQIRAHHDCQPKIDIADAKYDNTDNYTFLRENGSIPIIDYNVRRENLTAKALRERGYDRNGWPYAPCGMPTRPNGFDAARKRLTFCCMKQCLNLKAPGIRNLDKTYDISSCEHVNKTCGYTTHSSIDQHPRLLNEIPRGTRRYNDIKRCRSASERSNSTIKETLNILEKPSF